MELNILDYKIPIRNKKIGKSYPMLEDKTLFQLLLVNNVNYFFIIYKSILEYIGS